MPNDSTLSIIVKLQDDASAGLTALSTKMNSISASMGAAALSVQEKLTGFGTSMQSLGSKITSAGQSMSIGLTAPIVALGTAVVATSMKFQASMELIRTQAGATQAEVDSMTTSVLNLAKSGQTGQGPEALAEGLYHIESLGYRGAQALDILKTSADAADTGMANMEDVANALGAALVTGISGTESANQAMGILNATIGAGNMKMADLTAALGTGILPAAKNFGLSLTDVGAALATLTDNGMRADESATRLRMTFSLMAAPTQKATDALATLGLSQFQLADDMRTKGLVFAIQDLNDHLKASGETATQQAATLSEAFGGGRTSAAILTLTQQVDRLKSKYEQITDTAGKFNDAVAATHENNQFKLNAALAQMQATLIDIGGTVMPLVATALQKLSVLMGEFVAWWDKLSPSTKNFIVIAAGVIAVLGPLLVIIGSVISAIGTISVVLGAISLPILGFIAGLALIAWTCKNVYDITVIVVGYLIDNWPRVTAFLTKLIQAFAKDWNAVWQGIHDFFASIWNDMTAIVSKVVSGIQSAIQTVIDAYNRMKAIVSVPISIVSNAVSSVVSSIGSAVSSIAKHEAGGFVDAPRGTAVPIIAHGGEEIIPAEQVASRGRGNNVTIIIQNPTVRSQGDINEMRKQIEMMMRPLLTNAKIAHV